MGENNKIKNMKKNPVMPTTDNSSLEAEMIQELRKQCKKLAADVRGLQKLYDKSIEAYDAVMKHATELEEQNARLTQQLKDTKTKQ